MATRGGPGRRLSCGGGAGRGWWCGAAGAPLLVVRCGWGSAAGGGRRLGTAALVSERVSGWCGGGAGMVTRAAWLRLWAAWSRLTRAEGLVAVGWAQIWVAAASMMAGWLRLGFGGGAGGRLGHGGFGMVVDAGLMAIKVVVADLLPGEGCFLFQNRS
ncbi:hypothetical protein Dimus_010000, partial [Dionaea muscipula]